MPKRRDLRTNDSHRWFLREWMARFGKRQVDLQKELGWSLGKASEIYNGQPYRQELVEEVAKWLAIAPYELLMQPDDADKLRKLRETAVQIADAFKTGNAK